MQYISKNVLNTVPTTNSLLYQYLQLPTDTKHRQITKYVPNIYLIVKSMHSSFHSRSIMYAFLVQWWPNNLMGKCRRVKALCPRSWFATVKFAYGFAVRSRLWVVGIVTSRIAQWYIIYEPIIKSSHPY